MENFEQQVYVPRAWTESKGLEKKAKVTVAVSADEKVELYDSYLLHYHTDYQHNKRVDYIPYSDIALYRTEKDGRYLYLYTDRLYRIAFLAASEPIAEKILSGISKELESYEQWLRKHYGESGPLIYPPAKQLKYGGDGEILLYDNYIRCETPFYIHIIRYGDVRAVNILVESEIGVRFGVAGQTPLGAAIALSDFIQCACARAVAKRYLRIIKREVLRARGELAISVNGCGAVVRKPFAKGKVEGAIHPPTVLSGYPESAAVLTLFASHLTYRCHSYLDEYSVPEDLCVPYESIVKMECSCVRGGSAGTVYEVKLYVKERSEALILRTYTAAGQKEYNLLVELLQQKLKEYAKGAL